MRKYTYSRTIEGPEGPETFTADEFDSFDEAQKAVDKGVYDRRLQIGTQSKDRPSPKVPNPVLPPEGNNKVFVPGPQTTLSPGPSTTLNQNNEAGGSTKN